MMFLICILFVLNVATGAAKSEEATMNPSTAFVEVLQSDGRSAEIRSESDIYSWLVGSWKIRAVDYGEDGSKKETQAEWHFARVLEGRAIQDVFIVPSRDQRSVVTPKERNRYGTSVRYYDPEIDAWHITWINPVRSMENHLVGRKTGNEIVQEGIDEDGRWMRWSFRDITPNSFRWTGEESTDQGKSWRLGAEFFGVRMAESAAVAPLSMPAIDLPHGSMNIEREAMWVSTDERTFESLRLQSGEDAVTADGWIIHLDEKSYRIQYRIECDAQWRVRKLEMTRLGDDPGSLSLHSDGTGHWTDDRGKPVTSLAGCLDVDIYASPFTNTLPIRRLALKPQQDETIAVAFVTLPDLQVTAVRQRYTLLTVDQTGATYRFEGLNSGFKTDLPVDSDGLVIEYPGFFKRIWTRSIR